MNLKSVFLALTMSMAATDLPFPQTGGSVAAQKGRVERIKVHGSRSKPTSKAIHQIAAAGSMRSRNEDGLLDEPTPTRFADREWRW